MAFRWRWSKYAKRGTTGNKFFASFFMATLKVNGINIDIQRTASFRANSDGSSVAVCK